ncbi:MULTISPECIES: hypothetical protein [unclassified Mesorhizobium]|uniref:hypothetical protein n=1 Tax=unclassified Mesorhizobium TaxID=325217 RepID=UPI00241663E6|nr:MULTISPECIES: hypothetical protein [unclassified Mesorhizobium]WFP65614.1 hypothetical protein QAZ47_14235 [Mesorhizobium sp. WSM4904]WFP78878.1 hypothetical protein QAZ22_14175 [Mesorhizobium sp. WSM4906]
MFGRSTLVLACIALSFGVANAADSRCVVTSYNPVKGIPPGYAESQGFKGRFDYPKTTSEQPPDFLANKDFRADWRGYMNAVLDYAFEGNEDGTEAGVPTSFRHP